MLVQYNLNTKNSGELPVVERHSPILKVSVCTRRWRFLFLSGKRKCIWCWFLLGNSWNGWNELNPFGCKQSCKTLQNVGMLQDEFATCWNTTAISQQEQLGEMLRVPIAAKLKVQESGPDIRPHTWEKLNQNSKRWILDLIHVLILGISWTEKVRSDPSHSGVKQKVQKVEPVPYLTTHTWEKLDQKSKGKSKT